MAVATPVDQFLAVLRRSNLADPRRLEAYLDERREQAALPDDSKELATLLVKDGFLTRLQAQQLLRGKHKGFVINGKYKLLELLGIGGMGQVFLCEHILLKRLVAVKMLSVTKSAQDASAKERFYREARAGFSLNHPNIVRSLDVDRADKVHFLVMEYIDGISLHEIISQHGRLHYVRAAHYIAQAAAGLQHAHEAGWIHRDIKPGNILIDRQGVARVLDMGLARLLPDTADQLTKNQNNNNILGTADFLAPEQAMNSHDVDIRADIYGLGATFYFMVTGQSPLEGGTVAQKLMRLQLNPPPPVRDLCAEVPEEMAAVIDKMMAKKPEDRYQLPVEVVEALEPWTSIPISPPPEQVFRRLSPLTVKLIEASTGQAPTTPAGSLAAPSSHGSRNHPALASRPASSSGSLRNTQPALQVETKVNGAPSSRTNQRHPAAADVPAGVAALLDGLRAQPRLWLGVKVGAAAVAAMGLVLLGRLLW
jgi:serine/threonine protein kinase